MKRFAAIGVAALLAVGVVLALVLGGRGDKGGSGGSGSNAGATGGQDGGLTEVHGLIGSEKLAFFEDPEVQQVFAKKGLKVSVSKAGSREIATHPGLASADFAFPSSAPAGDRIKRDTNLSVKGDYSPFYSPMAIATFQDVVTGMKQKGLVKDDNGTQVFDVATYLDLVQPKQPGVQPARWSDIPGQPASATQPLLVKTTDVAKSNSAAMFLSATSYVANGNQVVDGPAAIDKVKSLMTTVFRARGYAESSSEGPFTDYLSSVGPATSKLTLIYEQQWLEKAILQPGALQGGRVMIYPSPDVFSKHTLVALSDNGKLVGEALENDPELARLAARHGFRTKDPQVFSTVLAQAKPPISEPKLPGGVVDPPSYDNLEALITSVDQQIIATTGK